MFILLGLLALCGAAAGGLQPRAYTALPYASITPTGWLREELQVQVGRLIEAVSTSPLCA